MLLTLYKGKEQDIFISEKITDEDEFMYPAYRQAATALRSIARQTKSFQRLDRKENGVEIYGYCHNIIAFSGSRGQGKTSAMLSFSRGLEHSFYTKGSEAYGDPLRECSFTVLPPIDPTVLERDQSILAVILSRMYRLAEKSWPTAYRRQEFSSGIQFDESNRNELLRLFQQCLSGINNIKFRKGSEIRSLIEMHEISDSAVLKDNFTRLTSHLLKLCQRDEGAAMPFLVVQLDDTDFQIPKSYEIMEDIRKYLTIPNMVILMAADLDMLRTTLTQHFIQEFAAGLDHDIIDTNKLRKIESKYLDKLIPPTHAVYLPHLDDIIRQQGALLRIRYMDRDGTNPTENILQPPQCHRQGGRFFISRAGSAVYLSKNADCVCGS